jgi:RHS repeat-associated protein
MRSLARSKTPNSQHARPNAQLSHQRLLLLLLLLLVLSSARTLQAQVGNNNPGGPAGIFNGDAGGRPVDPYTGNGTTSIVDLSIAAGVGDYGSLTLVRTANSRSIVSNNPFGAPGGWNHSYNWILSSNVSTTANFHPTWYRVDFPDGRSEVFQSVTWDTSAYRMRVSGGTASSSAGVRERLVQLNLSTLLASLLVPDGGKVEFTAAQHSVLYNGTRYYYYQYKATAIIDPYGVRTSLTYDGQGRLSTVAQPQATGRSLQFYYRPNNSLLIDHVTEVINGVNRRTVQYNYSNISPGGTTYLALTSVTYYGQAQWTASYKYRAPNMAPTSGVPLLWTCDEPIYSGPMKRIAYIYQTANNADATTPVYGQVYQEKYWDGVANHEAQGAAVFTLTVGAPNNRNTRKETRGDNKTRTFNYGTGSLSGYLINCTDFMNHSASQTYDAKNYINSVTDRNGHTTNYTSDPVTGNVTQIQYPFTQGDTPGQGVRPTVNYSYVFDYYMNSSQDEAGNTTLFFRDPSTHRITQINYPDTGYEQFTYNGFGQVLTHRMTTGGTETFTYDTRGLKQTYRDPTNIGYNPSLRYHYDGLDRVIAITDAFGSADPSGDPDHSTSFSYNDRGQVLVTTLPKDPVDVLNRRFTITNAYNPDGTLQSKTNELGFWTSYTYDDYRRLKSVTPPGRGDGTAARTTYFSYHVNGILDDYRYTDSNVCWVLLPSGKWINTTYDDNRRKSSVTVGYGTGDAATTGYTYNNVGNVTIVTNARNQTTTTAYDERNRPSSITDALNHTTSFTYDTGGRKKTVMRPNYQTISYDTYDAMNRLTQQTASGGGGTTKYNYYRGSGLLQSMQDPHLVDLNNGYQYTYEYDAMGRKKKVTYPPDSANVQRTEQFTYDAMGRLQTFTNRDGKVQTFEYDALNRLTDFFWNDGGTTPRVDFTYDVGSRLTDINNANATIHRVYWNDNLLRSESETSTGGASRALTYFYDVDSNRAGSDVNHPGLQIPGYWFTYTYNNRNQLRQIKSGNTTLATYAYDENGYKGDVTTRTLANTTSSAYQYDALDRITHIAHSLNVRNTRTLDYAYDTVGNRRWTKRDGGNGDSFLYDYNDQVTALRLDVTNPESPPIRDTIFYDSSGNRTSFALTLNGPSDTYSINNLNQYTQRNATNAAYDINGNLTSGVDGSTYTYDAQNRLLSASKSGVTMTFKYDGLNRQVSRTVNGGPPTYSVWDGWDLVQEYHMSGNTVVEDASYLYGVTGLVKNLKTNNYYYQDGSGSTSHLANSSGTLLEWYRYDLQGAPVFYDTNNNQLSTSNYSVRHLFTGQQWYKEVGLYDLRNRFYSPDIGRLLQPDPIGFNGDPTNLYRYVGNNPVTNSDPTGEYAVYKAKGGYWYYIVNPGYQSYVPAGGYVPGSRGWCAAGAQILAGAYLGGPHMPTTDYWFRGRALGSATLPGTVVALGWIDGHYGGALMSPQEFFDENGFYYHTGIFVGFRGGKAVILDQWNLGENNGKPFGESTHSPDEWYEVYVPKKNGPYASGEATGQGSGDGGLTPYLASRYNPYYGYLSTSPTTNFAGGLAMRGGWHSPPGGPNFGVYTPTGGPIQGSIFGPGNFYSGLDPNAAFGHIYEGNPIGAGEGGRVPKEWR